jgi:hypothetical protein
MRRILAIFAIVSLCRAAQTKPDEKDRYERVAALGKLWKMFRRALPDSPLRSCLDRLPNRLTKIVAEARRLGIP